MYATLLLYVYQKDVPTIVVKSTSHRSCKMDPLSLLANLIAVANAAASVSERLRKLAGLRHVPQQILLLANEVSDFRCVLVNVDETIRRLSETQTTTQNLGLEHIIHRLIREAFAHLDEIGGILDSGLIRNTDTTKPERKFSWSMWLRSHGYLQRLSAALRNVRRDLSKALIILTASEAPSIRAQLESIIIMTDETRKFAAKTIESVGARLESVTQEIDTIQPSFEWLESTLNQLQVTRQPPRKRLRDPATNSSQSSLKSQGPTFQVRTSLQKTCNIGCRCQCHERTSLSSPKWMKDIVGLMFIDYSGKPSLRKQNCNEKLCQQQDNSLLKITYYFPLWFLQRMIVFRDHSKSLLASERTVSVRTPRIVGPDAPPVMLAQLGNVRAMQTLFSKREASPFDTLPGGESLLHIAVAWKRPDMCRLLLDESADPNQESVNKEYPIGTVWDLALQDPHNPSHQELKSVFEAFLDPTADLQNKRFSIVHQCVLGLSQVKLEDYLLYSTSDIDSHCSKGRPPLFWAASSSNLSAISTLLDFEASVDFTDVRGHNVLHRAIKGSCNIEVMKIILRTASTKSPQPFGHVKWNSGNMAGVSQCLACPPNHLVQKLVNQEDNWGWTPLCCAARHYLPEHAEILLDYGCTIQTGRESLAPTLLVAIQSGAISVVELLLKRGGRMDVMETGTQDGILHYAASFGCAKIFQLLGDSNDCCLSTQDENSKGLTALQVFDTERPKFLSENSQAFLKSRKAFVELLDKIDRCNLDHRCSESGEASESVMCVADEVLETSSLHSNDEYFFDAKSTFED